MNPTKILAGEGAAAVVGEGAEALVERAGDLFFHLSEAPRDVQVGDEFEFVVGINERSNRECAVRLEKLAPGTVKFERVIPGWWAGIVDRDIRVPGGPSAYQARKSHPDRAADFRRIETAYDGLIRITSAVAAAPAAEEKEGEAMEGQDEEVVEQERIVNRMASFALVCVLPAPALDGSGEVDQLLSRGDEVEVQLAEDKVTGRLKTVAARLVMSARIRREQEELKRLKHINAPRELYFALASVEFPEELGVRDKAQGMSLIKEGAPMEFWAVAQADREGRPTWRAVGPKLLPPSVAAAEAPIVCDVTGIVARPPTYSTKDPRPGTARFQLEGEALSATGAGSGVASFMGRDIVPGLGLGEECRGEGAVRVEVGDEILADLVKVCLSGQVRAKNVRVAKLKGPRMEGIVANLRDREGFGFIKPSHNSQGGLNGSNVFFHVGDVFYGASELVESMEVRYTLLAPKEAARAQILRFALADVEPALIEGPIQVGDTVMFDRLRCDGGVHGDGYRAAHVVLTKKAARTRGVVVDVNHDRHFGFLVCADTTERLFFHLSEVIPPAQEPSSTSTSDAPQQQQQQSRGPVPHRRKPPQAGSAVVGKGQEVSFTMGVRHGKNIGLQVQCLPKGTIPPALVLPDRYLGVVAEAAKPANEGQAAGEGVVVVLQRVEGSAGASDGDGSVAMPNGSTHQDEQGHGEVPGQQQQQQPSVASALHVPAFKVLPLDAEACAETLQRGQIVELSVVFSSGGKVKGGKGIVTVTAADVKLTDKGTLPTMRGKVTMVDAKQSICHVQRTPPVPAPAPVAADSEAAPADAPPPPPPATLATLAAAAAPQPSVKDFFHWSDLLDASSLGPVRERDNVEYICVPLPLPEQGQGDLAITPAPGRVTGVVRVREARALQGSSPAPRSGLKTHLGGTQVRMAKGPDGTAGFVPGWRTSAAGGDDAAVVVDDVVEDAGADETAEEVGEQGTGVAEHG
ncbi:hypothetical protein JKP88DRAFT_347862 [Tribonema minus]|uniref:Cold shock domain-containing protein E1 n=1 Tax=Tribonema minus TaxID=303371 RepID=A0A836CJ69_9STRA|nr:hypothetical protein JKP88DRAFT_347862 [Tribonema minus]